MVPRVCRPRGRRVLNRGAAVAMLVLGPYAAFAALDQNAEYPTAQCAAFFYGRDDYVSRSAYLDRTPGDLALARGLRDAAVRLNGRRANEVDAFITQERKTMAFLFDTYIFGGDDQSRELHDRLVATCVDTAAQTPETKAAP